MTCRLLIKIPSDVIVLHHFSYKEEGFELLVFRCKKCDQAHISLQSFEFTLENTVEIKEEDFKDFLGTLYKETVKVTKQVNMQSYIQFMETHNVY